MAVTTQTTLLEIRREAGVLSSPLDEELETQGDGTITKFALPNIPIGDDGGTPVVTAKADDAGTITDLVVTRIDRNVITVSSAPADGASILVSYNYSAFSDALVEKVRTDALAVVNQKLSNRVYEGTYQAVTLDQAIVDPIVRILAGALIMITQFGANAGNEDLAESGYEKEKLAKKMLNDALEGTIAYNIAEAPEGYLEEGKDYFSGDLP